MNNLMYKPRGKPHEARNVALAQQQVSLAETIMISPITKSPSFRNFKSNSKVVPTVRHGGYYNTSNSPEIELRQQRHHFEAFREAYQERVGKKRIVYNTSKIVQGPTSFEPEPMMKDFLSRYGIRKISEIRKPHLIPMLPPVRQKSTVKRPVLVRNTIRTIKPQYPLQKLEYGADFPEEPPKSILKKNTISSNATIAAIKELEVIENDLLTSVSNDKLIKDVKTKMSNPEDREELFKQLQATENQISVATSQLQAIQKILQDNRMLTTVQEEEESDEHEKSCQTDDVKPKLNTKWKVKTTLRGSQNKRARLVDTLNLLNNRLQNMQDKYFNAPKVKYKTFEEVLADKSKRKGIETIYQNMRYDYDSAIEMDLQPTNSSELKHLLDKADVNVKRGKSEPMNKIYAVQSSCDSISRDRSNNTATISTSKVAVNKSKNSVEVTTNLTNSTITSTNAFSSKFDIKNLKSCAELLSEINCTDVIFPPRKNPSGDGPKYNNIVFDEDEETTANNSGLENAIEKSIKASNYLSREFETLRGDYGKKLDDMLQMRAKNVRISEPFEVAERVEQVCSPAANRIKHMFSKFDTILKDSLYSTDT